MADNNNRKLVFKDNAYAWLGELVIGLPVIGQRSPPPSPPDPKEPKTSVYSSKEAELSQEDGHKTQLQSSGD